MIVRAHSGWRQITAATAILGLVIQAALGAFMMAMPPARAAMAISRDTGSPVCTPQGFKSLPPRAGEDGQPSARVDCAICAMLAAAASASLPAVQSVLPPEFQAVRLAPSPARQCQPGATILAHHNRGPPRLI
jgi:hypothetical protein